MGCKWKHFGRSANGLAHCIAPIKIKIQSHEAYVLSGRTVSNSVCQGKVAYIFFVPFDNLQHIFDISSTKVLDPLNALLFDSINPDAFSDTLKDGRIYLHIPTGSRAEYRLICRLLVAQNGVQASVTWKVREIPNVSWARSPTQTPMKGSFLPLNFRNNIYRLWFRGTSSFLLQRFELLVGKLCVIDAGSCCFKLSFLFF